MSLRFTKMHGLGNDFIVIDAIRQSIHLTKEMIIDLAKRNTGIGFDQCLLVEPSQQEGIDFFYRIFNADGNEVGQCGNGARCLARFVQYYNLSRKTCLTIATKTARMQLQINADKTVTVNMGAPKLCPKDIPMQVDTQAQHYALKIKDNENYSFHALNVGNPHIVLLLKNLSTQLINKLGKRLSTHAMFPEGTNVGFMEIVDKNKINLRVYERGCGETKACGSGAVAAAAISMLFYQLNEHINICLPGGQLVVKWPNKQGPIYLNGPAEFIYEGILFN